MEKPAQNIQDSFLNNARKEKVVLTIYLMSGVKLSGRIKPHNRSNRLRFMLLHLPLHSAHVVPASAGALA